MTKYLVIVYPAPPAKRDMGSNPSWSQDRQPQVKWVTARCLKVATEQVRVEPGGHVLVIPEDKVTRFDRAKEAPLEEKTAAGAPLPQAMEATAA